MAGEAGTPKKTLHVYGPWKGIKESGGGDEDFEALWNCEINGADLVTRGGRQPFFTGNLLTYPAAAHVVSWNDSYLYGEFLDELTKAPWASPVSLAHVGGVVHANTGLILGFSQPITKFLITISAANSVTSALSIDFYGPNGWTAATITLDETTAAGKAFGTIARTGGAEVDITAAGWLPSGPPPGDILYGPKLYWVRFNFSAVLTATTAITKVVGILSVSSNSLLTGANGFYQWRTPGGERLLIVGLDDRDAGIARLFVYDRIGKNFTPIAIEDDAAKSGPEATWCFVSISTAGLALCNGYCLLYIRSDRPYEAKPFKPILKEKDNSAVNTPPTSADFLFEYEGRLFALKDNTVYVSRPYGDIYGIDARADAPLGGCSVFYNSSFFSILDPSGGRITGGAVIGTMAAIFTPRTTWIVTGLDDSSAPNSIRCIDKSVGCVAPRSLRQVDQGAVLFLGPDGVYVCDGTSNVLVSKDIEKTIGGLSAFAQRNAVAEVYRRKGQYRLWVADGGGLRNNLGLVFDLARKAWTKFGLPRFLVDMPRTLGGAETLYWDPMEISCLLSARDEEWDEDCCPSGTTGSCTRKTSATSTARSRFRTSASPVRSTRRTRPTSDCGICGRSPRRTAT